MFFEPTRRRVSFRMKWERLSGSRMRARRG